MINTNAVEFINQHIDLLSILNHYGFKHIKEQEQYIRCACAIHGGNNPTAFVFNKENNLWYCHTGCHKGGDVYDLIMDMEKVSFKDAVHICASILKLNIESLVIYERNNKTLEETKRWIEFIRSQSRKKEHKLFDLSLYDLKEVNKLRSFKEETLKRFNVYFTHVFPIPEGNLNNRLVFPIYYMNQCVGVSLRKTKGNDYPKWSHQPKGIETSRLLYNYDNAVEYIRGNRITEFIVVEGIFDTMAYYEEGIYNVVATFGSHITTEQQKLLLKHVPDITLSFDGDKAGILATKKAYSELHNKANIKVVMLKDGHDPCSVQSELKDLYNKKMSYMRWVKEIETG